MGTQCRISCPTPNRWQSLVSRTSFGWRIVLRGFVKAGRDCGILATYEDGLKATAIAVAANESMTTGQSSGSPHRHLFEKERTMRIKQSVCYPIFHLTDANLTICSGHARRSLRRRRAVGRGDDFEEVMETAKRTIWQCPA